MSDESRTNQPEAAIHANHWCEHEGCNAWGGFGHQQGRADRVIWRCWEHYDHKPNKTLVEVAKIAETLQRFR